MLVITRRPDEEIVIEGGIRIVVLGVDGSPGANAAVHAVAARLWPGGTEVRVVTIDNTVRPTGMIGLVPAAAAWVRESNEEQIAKAHAMLEQSADTLLDAGLVVSTRTHSGAPAEILNQEARSWDASSIFVGALGFARARGYRHAGSVATALITHAPCPVEIVRSEQSHSAED